MINWAGGPEDHEQEPKRRRGDPMHEPQLTSSLAVSPEKPAELAQQSAGADEGVGRWGEGGERPVLVSFGRGGGAAVPVVPGARRWRGPAPGRGGEASAGLGALSERRGP